MNEKILALAALAKSKDSGGNVDQGLSFTARNALMNAFAHVAWTDENGQSYYDALRDALYEDWVSVTGISLSKSSESIYTGYDTTVTANVSPSNATDKSIVWTSSNETVARIEGSGNTVTIKGIADGSAVITATTVDGGYIDTFTVTVANAEVIGITLSNSTGDITVGGTFELTATVTPVEAVNKTVTWKTSDANVATVTASADTLTATVTAVGEGTAIITATTNENGKTATFTANVSDVELVEIVPTLLTRTEQSKFNYAYTFDDYDSVDTTDKSKIKQTGDWRWLCFDCTNARKIRVKRYINQLTYGSAGYPLLAYNNEPDVAQKWLSDPSTSDTSDVCVTFPMAFSASAYLDSKPGVGDAVTVGDFEINEGFKYLVIRHPHNMNDNNAPTDLDSYKNEDGYWWTGGTSDLLKIYIVE